MSASLNNAKNDAVKFNSHVVSSVIEQCKKLFIEEGFDDAVLEDLRTMWTHRLAQLSRSHAPQVAPTAAAATVERQRLSSAAQAAAQGLPTVLLTNPALQSRSMAMPAGQSIVMLSDGSQILLQGPMKDASVTQLDGAAQDSSSDEDDGNDHFSEEDEEEEEEGEPQDDPEGEEDPQPLCSEDDGSDPEDAEKLFDTENLVLAQYDKISRSRNKWKFALKAGVMNLNGCDYVFSKATGDAEW